MIQTNLNADFWVEVNIAVRCQKDTPGKFTAKEFAFPWKSHAVSLAPGRKPVRLGIRR